LSLVAPGSGQDVRAWWELSLLARDGVVPAHKSAPTAKATMGIRRISPASNWCEYERLATDTHDGRQTVRES